MPEPKQLSREYRIYLALWRKAFLSEAEVSIKCSSWQMAIAMRQGMYRAIRPFRNGQANDEELKIASEKFVVFLQKLDDPAEEHVLIIRPRATLDELDSMFEALGLDEDDLLLGEEKALNTKLTEFIEQPTIERDFTKRKSTAFYERD